MGEAKTRPTNVGVNDFIAALDGPRRRDEAQTLIDLMAKVSGEAPVMWGPTVIGFGHRHYAYASGHAGETFRIGFSPRKANLVVYGARACPDADALIARLGKTRSGKGCLYIAKLVDIDLAVMRELLSGALAATA